MLSFAVAPSIDLNMNWFAVVQWEFVFYISVSFVCVTWYMLGQLRAGRLLNNRYSPPEFMVPPWFWQILALCLASLFLFPALFYALVPVTAVAVAGTEPFAARYQVGVGNLSPGRLAGWSILLCGAIVFVEIPLLDGATSLLALFHIPNPEQTTVTEFKSFHRAPDILLFLFMAVVCSPIIEEIFFRGFLFTFCKNHTSIIFAAVLSGGVFAFAHLNLGSVVPLWFLGIVLALAYQHTGSLLLPICVHGLFNLMTGLSMLLEKGAS